MGARSLSCVSLFLLFASSCTAPESNPAPAPEDSCAFARDGVCDEPANCALGTDSTDCVAACSGGGPTWLFAAACAHRQGAPAAPGYPDARPTHGSQGLTGTFDQTLTLPSGDGHPVVREYRLYVPASYDPKQPHPLVINMPGHRVGHLELTDSTQLLRSADLNGFLVVFAGQEFRQGRWAWWTDWDWKNRKAENPDFGFLRAIIEQVEFVWNVDQRRIYLSGHSRGAAMAFIAAMEMPDLIAGAAVESGFTELGYLDTLAASYPRKVPFVFIHGIQDEDVCIDCRPGGTCGVNGSSCGTGFHAADAIVERLRQLGWTDDDLVYYRLENVTHRWQTQLNEQWWEFLSKRPLP